MSVSDAQFARWLDAADRKPCWLVEIDYTVEVAGAPATKTLYFAKTPDFWTFTSTSSDTPASTRYEDLVLQLPKYVRSIDSSKLGGSYSVSFGSLILNNHDDYLDPILLYAYDGSAYRQYYGDARWAKADFRLIFSAFGKSISAPERGKIEYQLQDTLTFLNRNIGGDEVIGGTGPNAGKPVPTNIGNVNNLKLELEQVVPTLKYRYGRTVDSTDGNQYVRAVREIGNDLSGVWVDNHDGTITMSRSASGDLTADVVRFSDVVGGGVQTSHAYQTIASQLAGLFSRGLTVNNHPSFTLVDDQDYQVGLTLSDNRNALDVLSELADSTNTFYAPSRDGNLNYGRIYPYNPQGAPVISLVDDDVKDANSPKLSALIPLYDQIQCRGRKNWFPQTTLATSLSDDVRALYSRAGCQFSEDAPSGTSYATNPALYHKSMSISPVIDTLISTFDDDSTKAELGTFAKTRRRKFLPWVQVLPLTVGIRAYFVEIGDVVQMTLGMFNLQSGKLGQAISVGIDADNDQVELQLVFRFGPTDGVEEDWLMEDGVTLIDMEDGVTPIVYAA